MNSSEEATPIMASLEAFKKAYLNNVAGTDKDTLDEFMDAFLSDEEPNEINKRFVFEYGSIVDAYFMWNDAVTYAQANKNQIK